MAIRITCPACKSSYPIDDALRGKRILCRECNKHLVVPAAKTKPLPEDDREEPEPGVMKVNAMPAPAKGTQAPSPPAGRRAIPWGAIAAPLAAIRGVKVIWLAAGLGGIALLGALLFFLWFALTRVPTPIDTEASVIDNLKPYGGRYELDGEGHIVRIMLEGAQATDDALDDLYKLPYLQKLSLAKSSVTDAGLLKVTKLKGLMNLGLTGTGVTDEGLAHLERMPALQNLWVVESDKLTSEGISSLQQALPGLKIHVMYKGKEKKKKEPG